MPGPIEATERKSHLELLVDQASEHIDNCQKQGGNISPAVIRMLIAVLSLLMRLDARDRQKYIQKLDEALKNITIDIQGTINGRTVIVLTFVGVAAGLAPMGMQFSQLFGFSENMVRLLQGAAQLGSGAAQGVMSLQGMAKDSAERVRIVLQHEQQVFKNKQEDTRQRKGELTQNAEQAKQTRNELDAGEHRAFEAQETR